MNSLPVIYVFTHESLAMGEDGPAHQLARGTVSICL
jgi:transketolase